MFLTSLFMFVVVVLNSDSLHMYPFVYLYSAVMPAQGKVSDFGH